MLTEGSPHLLNEGWRNMSDSSTLTRLASRPGLDAHLREPEDELCDNLGCFGYLRGVRERAVMLELRKKGGNILAIGYAWIERITFDPSEGITLHAAGQRVLIVGKHLNGPEGARARLFAGLAQHRVPWIQEASQAECFARSSLACVVEAIEWSAVPT